MTALVVGGLPPMTQRTRPHRITVDVGAELYSWLTRARIEDRLSTAERIRALLELDREDSHLAGRVIQKAQQIAEEHAEQT